VLDFARARGWREGDNPARWKGHLENLLPKPRKIAPVRHYKAMPYADVPAFMARLRRLDSVAARCLEFLILTASRNGEARKATFDEVAGDVWTVPGERMKRGKPHRVPLSPAARAVVKRMRAGAKGKFIFPSRSGALGDTALDDLLDDMKVGMTVHGFRSSFRDWAAETGFARELAELALSHRVGNDTEAAYFRSDLLEQRAALMVAWARHCAGEVGAGVPLVRRHG
jgi:integrase